MSKFKKPNFSTAVKENSERQESKGSGSSYLKLPKNVKMFFEKEGKISLDIIPYIVNVKNHPDRNEEAKIAIPGYLWYRSSFRIHRNIGADNETIVCPTTFGRPCPVCEEFKRRQADGAEWDDIKPLKFSNRSLYAVIPIGAKKYEEEIHIWDVSDFCFQEQLNKEIREKESCANFPDLEEGKTLSIRFEEKALGKNKFCTANRIDFENRDAYDDDIVDDVPDLDSLLVIHSYKTIENMFYEIASDEDDSAQEIDDDEDDKPQSKRKKKSSASLEEKKKKFDPLNDEDDDEDDEPVRKKKPAVEEDEDDDDEPIPVRKKKPIVEEEEEDTDSKPRKRMAGSASKKEESIEEDDDDDTKSNDDDDDDDELELPKNLIKLMNWRVSYKGFAGMVVAVNPESRSCTIKNGDDETKVGVPVSKLTLIKSYTPPTGPRPGKESPKKSFQSKSEMDAAKKKTKCPFGYKWGTAEEHKECDHCDKWDDCIEETE